VGTKNKLGGIFMCAKQSQKDSMELVNLLTKQTYYAKLSQTDLVNFGVTRRMK
jgi:hypothetical protein